MLSMEIPWLVIGDFNCVLQEEERSSKKRASNSFGSWVGKNDLLDLGFVGSYFTWSHGRSVETKRAASLDRALCCDEWKREFVDAKVQHLNHSYSDHCPIMLEMNEASSDRLGERPFQFLAAWMLHGEFLKWMESEWLSEVNLTCSLESLTKKLKVWNRDTFGNINRRKNKL